MLKDVNGNIRYVGQTMLPIKERLSWHFKGLRQKIRRGLRLSPAERWLDAELEKNHPPTIHMLDERGQWDISEAVWIDRLRHQGHKLLNVQSVVPD